MKGFKKLALVAAISAAPFAQAELTAMDDSLLSEMTGQAGVSIELDTAITIKSLTYTDTDGGDTSASGSLSLNNIAFGGGTVGGSVDGLHGARLDDIKIDIDVDDTDGLIIHLGGTDNLGALSGSAPVDFGLSVGSVRTGSVVQDIASDIKIAGNLGPIDIKIDGDGADAANDLISVEAYFEVTSGSLDVDVIGLGIESLKIGQDSSPILASSSAYQQDIKTGIYLASQSTGSPIPSIAAVDTIIAGEVNTQQNAYAANEDTLAQAAWVEVGTTGVDVNNKTQAEVGSDASAAALANAPLMAGIAEQTTVGWLKAALGSAPNNVNNMAYVSMSIATADTGYFDIDTLSPVAVTNALAITIDSLNIDVSMDLVLGGTNIGNVAIDDLNMSGTKLFIYGH